MPNRPLTKEQKQKREGAYFARRIQSTFKSAGFVYLPTRDITRQFGKKKGELDAVFLYENIVLICEDTIATSSARDHLKNKQLLAQQILENKQDLIDWLKEKFPDRFDQFADYDVSRYQVYFLYFSKFKMDLSSDDLDLFAPIKIVENTTLSYFQKMAQNIKFSSRTDIFRFLGLKSKDVGTQVSSAAQKLIETTIIYPSDNTGLKNGVRIVSFMISAEALLRNSFVLRKDNWEDSIGLYQRLIERDRIVSIRKYLATKKTTFFNNIIVSLPRDLVFQNSMGEVVDLAEAETFGSHKMLIPDEFNSICVIDGQHRIFAHYEGDDGYESTIAKLRGKLHLLATGLIFPSNMSDLDQRKYESEIFLDINSNAKPVPPDVLLFIETLKDPFSDLGIARQVLSKLNSKSIFKNKFQLSLMEDSEIKIASIIKFALRYLVDITDNPDRPSLFTFWASGAAGRDELLKRRDTELLEAYVLFVAQELDLYFSAVRKRFVGEWGDADSKILSTTSINAFLMALRRSLPSDGPRDLDGYSELFDRLSIDFSKSAFGYTSSQYNKFSKVILTEAFGLREVGGSWQKPEEDAIQSI